MVNFTIVYVMVRCISKHISSVMSDVSHNRYHDPIMRFGCGGVMDELLMYVSVRLRRFG